MMSAYTSAASACRRGNSPCTRNGPYVRGSGGSKISHMPSALVAQPTSTPSTGSSHHWWKSWSTTATGMPSRKPKMNPKFTISPQLLLAEVAEDADHQRRVLAELVDHHELGVEQLVDVLADLVGDVLDDRGQLGLHPLDQRPAAPRRAGRARAAGARGSMISSTTSGMSGSKTSTMCSAILSGSSCW